MATITNGDFKPGNPANHVLGKDDEQPARVHGEQKPKPIKTKNGIVADIEMRIEEIKPMIAEYDTLVMLLGILKPRKTRASKKPTKTRK